MQKIYFVIKNIRLESNFEPNDKDQYVQSKQKIVLDLADNDGNLWEAHYDILKVTYKEISEVDKAEEKMTVNEKQE